MYSKRRKPDTLYSVGRRVRWSTRGALRGISYQNYERVALFHLQEFAVLPQLLLNDVFTRLLIIALLVIATRKWFDKLRYIHAVKYRILLCMMHTHVLGMSYMGVL